MFPASPIQAFWPVFFRSGLDTSRQPMILHNIFLALRMPELRVRFFCRRTSLPVAVCFVGRNYLNTYIKPYGPCRPKIDWRIPEAAVDIYISAYIRAEN